MHGFSDASNLGYGLVVYLRKSVNGVAIVAIVFGRSKVVLRNQDSLPFARKELVAVVTTAELSKQALNALGLPGCTLYFWCDSRDMLQWIQTKDLRLDKFVCRRIAKILLYSEPESWRYCHNSVNPADVASRSDGVKKSELHKLWFEGPEFLRQSDEIPVVEGSSVSFKRVTCVKDNNELSFPEISCIDRMIEAAPSLCVEKASCLLVGIC